MPENIYVGSKPLLNYVTKVAIEYQRTGVVTIHGRGKNVVTAIDVAQVTKRSFVKNALISKVEIKTEDLGGEDESRKVSVIEIVLIKDDNESPLYVAWWKNGYTPGVQLVPKSFFNEDMGYNEVDQIKVGDLEVGKHMFFELGTREHGVTRIR